MKAYIVYQGCGWVGDWHAMLVSEEGRVLADHLCSSEGFMYGDLWGNRKERREKFPDLEVSETPMFWEKFREAHPDIFNLTFTLREDTP